ncbi:MAG: hypothetical protein QOG91_603 [Candidatus Parcubacteria bacterium]|jgi:hypothetical protein|nr:hypothetical protein [Candidatus Parcubacteria bacterium]
MDEKRAKIKKYVEDADIPAELKAKELEIVNDMDLSIPEVKIALTKLIGDEFDKTLDAAGINDVPNDPEVEKSLKEFESESEAAEKDLESDMKIVDENLKDISETSEEIQKAALKAGLD